MKYNPALQTPVVSDTQRNSGLPIREFLHPVSLAALALCAINDHLLKGANLLPSFVTGKLSDFAGLLFFPLFLTATVDTLLYFVSIPLEALGRRPLPYILTRAEAAAACIVTGALFTALQLLPAFKNLYIAAHRLIGLHVRVTQDPTDLIALLALPVAYRIATRVAKQPTNVSAARRGGGGSWG